MTCRTGRFLVTLTLIAAMVTAAPAQDKPYAHQMARLAEILGALHYLSGLCEPVPSPFRSQMADLLEAEAPDDVFRAQLVDRFNLGYSSFAAVHRACTRGARSALVLYRADGAALAAAIASRYGAPSAEEARGAQAIGRDGLGN